MKHLVIVESPNKVKSIEKYLGEDFSVMASVGHIVRLPSSGEHKWGVDLETWKPKYKIDPDKAKVVEELKAASSKADIVYVATDPDREGEAIADNLVEFLHISDKYKRIRFNEITKEAVNKAVQNPTVVDENLVKSQIARRILDRIIGYELSGLMRKKITSAPISPSAGRVQSIALKLVVDRENEIKAFVPVTYFTLDALLKGDEPLVANFYNPNIVGENKEWIKSEDVDKIKSSLKGILKVINVNVSTRNETKYTPLKQSALYKKADSQYGLSSKNVKRSLQSLYEGYGDGGLISYPRTDSTRLSDTFVASSHKYIANKYGENYAATEIKGSAGAQDAHEAIRPTDLSLTPKEAIEKFSLDSGAAKVYELIWTHTIQCLMVPPKKEVTRYELDDNGNNFRMTSTKIIFDGYYVVTDFERKKELPTMKEGDTFDVENFNFEEHQTQPPARYNDGSLIEKMDEIGVGRPSTFAEMVDHIKEREYVDMDGRALFPTEFGVTVFEKLGQAFPDIINEHYTAEMEKSLDEIAEGKQSYELLLNDFWKMFEKELQTATVELSITKMMPVYANKKCPLCGAELLVRRRKTDGGRFFGCERFPECTHAEPDPTEKRGRRRFFAKKDA